MDYRLRKCDTLREGIAYFGTRHRDGGRCNVQCYEWDYEAEDNERQ